MTVNLTSKQWATIQFALWTLQMSYEANGDDASDVQEVSIEVGKQSTIPPYNPDDDPIEFSEVPISGVPKLN